MQQIKLSPSTQINFKELIEQLVTLGYTRVQLVVDHGDLAVRGGIIDVYPSNAQQPLRLVFDLEVLTTIKTFDVNTQTSKESLNEITIARADAARNILVRSSAEDESSHIIISEIKQGDFVVHERYGIGCFHGLQEREFGSIRGEYIEIEYAGRDRIYTPIEQIKFIHKYSGLPNPSLTSLKDKTWQKAKNKAKRAAHDLALELLQMYKIRGQQPGFAFDEDSVWQIELEKSFPHKETHDQLSVMAKVKEDMESPRPMDRLVCGDVGYGKTEIALRAAFKAALSGKQTAIICPTTILAQQHYNTFKKRFEPFGHRIEMLSRFRTPAEKKKIKEQLTLGKIDLVIGTHALLQRDINFKNLGLVIIDEEQRFGVAHKEKLKKLRSLVDVLTLTATPIPRTLYLSLSGAKDISMLRTPPKNRFPIKTFLAEYNEKIIIEAITTELKRQGQAFFLSNKVSSIQKIYNHLKKLIPKARFLIGHGQMPKKELETVMIKFLNYEADVLICSTIIESGIDIPNANTLIIEEAPNLGLAQLHQLRGRVGRSNQHAFCYLLYNKKNSLTKKAWARLHTIKEYAALGAGYQIAMKDLEIRGAGDLLGSAQSGHINAIGFELFCKLIEQAIKKERGAHVFSETAYKLSQKKSAYLSTRYIEDYRQRIALYKRITAVETLAELESIHRECLDRFGTMPTETQQLFLEIASQLK